MKAILAAVHTASDLDSFVATQGRKNSGLIAMPNSFTIAYRLEITSLAAGHRLPAVYPYRSFAEVGGLLTYGVHLADNFQRATISLDPIQGRVRPQSSLSW